VAIRIPSTLLDDGPPVLLSLSLGFELGWGIASKAHFHLRSFFHGWPLVFLAFAGFSLITWILRGVVNDKEKLRREERDDETHSMVKELFLLQVTSAEPEVAPSPITYSGTGTINVRSINETSMSSDSVTRNVVGPSNPKDDSEESE
jgi:hypothetical protein